MAEIGLAIYSAAPVLVLAYFITVTKVDPKEPK